MSQKSAAARAVVFGCPIDHLTYESALNRVSEMVAAGKPSRLGAVNAAKLIKMETDPALAQAVTSSEVILPDGMGAVIAGWLLCGVKLKRVTGIDLMEKMVEQAAQKGYRLYFLGAKPEVLAAMKDKFKERFPGLQIAGSHHGYFDEKDEPALVDSIRSTNPDILFVGMGTPAKELWIDRNYAKSGARVSMGVGGSFDVFSGKVQRAPRVMQNLGLEWFYRFMQEPRRMWHRYFVTSIKFFFKVLAGFVRRPFSKSGAR